MRVLILLFSAGLCLAQDLAVRADELMGAYQKTARFMGTALIAKDGKAIFSKGYGYANLEHEVPNSPRTKFRLGSITKQFTALAILQQQEQGRLKVTDSICQFINNCPDHWNPVTIHHLLSHTSGIWNFTSSPDYIKQWMLDSPPAKTMERFRDRPLEFKPGSKMSYSNSGYILLALVLEKASGTGWEEYLRKNIFEPAGMQHSGHDTHSAILKHRATGYWFQGGEVRNSAYHDMSIPIGGGDLYSTVEDLLRWDQALYTEKLTKRPTLNTMFTSVLNDYGYGWRIDDEGKNRMLWHSGETIGFRNAIVRWPEQRFTVVVLTNRNAPGPYPLARRIAALYR